MRLGFVLAVALAAAQVSAAEPAPPPRSAAPLVSKVYPVVDLIHPHPEPPPACAPLGVLRPVTKADVVQAAAVLPCPLPTPMPPTKALRENGDKLIRLVTGQVQPDSWAEAGGRGSIRFDTKANALVICQTEAAHAVIGHLLHAMRKLYNRHVVLEIRVVEVPDTFFERAGVDFEVNVRKDGVAFRSDAPASRVVADPRAEPVILSDAQVVEFLAAVQTDRRSSVLHAPKVMAFDRQPITFQTTQEVTFLTGLELCAVPGGVEKRERVEAAEVGTRLTATPAVSADRKAVALDFGYEFAAVDPSVPVVPVQLAGTAGRVADAVLQKPAIQTGRVDVKLTIPDGQTAVVAGPAFAREERREFGPPVLSKVPYVNRLYRNVGVGRATNRHLLLVRARVIEQDEVPPAACVECRADTPAAASEAATLVAAYRAACADGRTEDAMTLALQALAKDPACFADVK